ncbi:MAG: hypothetical protein RLZZ08_1699 [Pseudomonadota bacterium]|jgi:uroporphyrinogen-III synthase
MTLPIIAIRPQPGCNATVAAGQTLGLAITGVPLFRIEPLDWAAPDPADVDALLIGSANALRHGGPGLAAFRGKPVHAVGSSTADAARAAGFAVAQIGSGGLQQVLDSMAPPGLRLLRLSGRDHVPLALPSGVQMQTRIVYASDPVPLPAATVQTLRGGALVLLHSAEAARHFAAECGRCGVDRTTVRLAALGPRIAAAAGQGWADLRSASSPQEPALLALAAQMCH